MPPTVADTLKDPKFYGLPLDQQERVLATLDRNYAALPMDEREKVIQMGKQRLGSNQAQPQTNYPSAPFGDIRPMTERERFSDPDLYPVGAKGEGVGENLHNIAQRAGVGVFQLADAFANPRKTLASLMSSVLPEPVVRAQNEAVDLINRIPGAHYLTTKFPQNTMNPLQAGYQAAVTSRGPVEMAGKVAPLAGQAIAADVIPTVATTALKEGVLTPTRIALQEAGGAGKEPVAMAVRSQEQRFADAQRDYQTRLREVQQENAKREAEARKSHSENLAQVQQENRTRIAEAQRAHKEHLDEIARENAERTEEARKQSEERRQSVEQSNAQSRQEYLRKEMEARRAEQKNAAIQSQKQSIERGQKAYAQRAVENAKQVYSNVKKELDSRWNILRDKIGNAPIKSGPIQDAINEAKEKFLMGAPESLKQFNDLIRTMQTDEMIDTPQGPQANIRSLTWQEGRTHYTALGDKLYSGELPGNVKQAVEMVRDELDKELTEAAAQNKLGPFYERAKSDWAQFKKDWDDMSNMSYSKRPLGEAGSPLARLVRSADPAAAARALSNERIAEQLARYQKQGANVNLVRGFRALDSRLDSLDKVQVPKHPSRPTYKPVPKDVEPSLRTPRDYAEPRLMKEPEYKGNRPQRTPKPPERPSPVNPTQIRYQKLVEYAGRPFRWYDFVTPTGIEHALLKSDALRRWVASQPRNEMIARSLLGGNQ